MTAPTTQISDPVLDQIQEEFAAKIRNAFDETLRENRHLSPVQLGAAIGVMGAAMMQFAAVRYINDDDAQGNPVEHLRDDFIHLAGHHFDFVASVITKQKGTVQ